jgi:hypothetical protein
MPKPGASKTNDVSLKVGKKELRKPNYQEN